MSEEIWKEIPEFKGYYQASNQGRIRSMPRKSWNGKTIVDRKTRILRNQNLPDGYQQVGIMMPGERQLRYYVHRLVASAFIPNVNNKPFVNHIDGVKHHNTPDNLEWVTKSENAKHSFATGLQCNKGEQHPSHKVTTADVLKIRERYKNGESTYHIFNSGDYKLSYTNIKDIVSRRLWVHV